MTPYLSIQSTEKQSGKTLCLQLLNLLCDHSDLTSGGFTARDLARPMNPKQIFALLLDECHTTLGTRNRPKAPAFRAMLAGSFHLGLGHSNLTEERNAFCPKAFAGNAPLPQDLADRCIPIILEPLRISALASSDDPIARFDVRHAIDEVLPIRNRLNHWADVHLLPRLDQLPPLPRSAFPPNLSPRQQDLSEPLLQLAGLIGGPWPVRAIKAFLRHLRTANPFRIPIQLAVADRHPRLLRRPRQP